jgi:NADH-quinone oxidoreductase subunit K
VIPLEHLLILGAILFTTGAVGVVIRRNVLIMLMGVELMLNAVNLTLVSFSSHLRDMDGHVLAFMVMAVAAAEATIGLAIVIALFRHKPSVNADDFTLMKG